MKVYFIGAHSTGKSTLCKYVSRKYSLPMIFETARYVLSEQELQIDTLRYDLDVTDKYQQQVFDRQVLEEQKYSSFVSDRSIIDILAYSGQHARILPQLMQAVELEPCLSILHKPDSFIFFVKPCKATLRADGVREAINWNGVVAIDAQIKLLLEIFKIRYFQIDTESMQERARIIDSILSLNQS
jgi:nicotinamide riboside kinase